MHSQSSGSHSPAVTRRLRRAADAPRPYPPNRPSPTRRPAPRPFLGLDPIPQRRRVDVQQPAHVPTCGELGLAVITQPVLVETHRAGAGLLIELTGSGHGSSLLAGSGASPPPRAIHHAGKVDERVDELRLTGPEAWGEPDLTPPSTSAAA